MAKTKTKTQKKGKAKKNGPRNRRERPAQIPSSRRVSSVPQIAHKRMPHVHAICAVTDPFCIHARGAQRPDGGPPTIPYQFRAVLTITANSTSGAARYTFVPNPFYQYTNAAVAAGTWTNSSNWLDIGGAGFLANAREIRIVSYGVIIRSAMTATTAKGLLILSVDPNPTVAGTSTQGSMQYNEAQVYTMAAGFEHAWVSRPMGASAHLFRPTADFTTTMTNFDWTSLIVEVNGSDVTSAMPFLTAEVVMNVEFTTLSGNNSTAVAQLQKTPPLPNRVAMAASDHSIANRPSFIQGGIDAAGAAISKAAKSSLDAILADGMALLFA